MCTPQKLLTDLTGVETEVALESLVDRRPPQIDGMDSSPLAPIDGDASKSP